MKMLLFALLLVSAGLSAQSLPITFESDITTGDFIDFDGGTAVVVSNPQPGGLNGSATVARIVRDGGAVFAGSKLSLSANLNFSIDNRLSMLVYTDAPVGTTVKFKLEGDGSAERDVETTVSGAWERLTWNFTGTPASYNELVFMFDFGNIGDGSATSTFYFDDVRQEFGGTQIDWPVDFEGDAVDYTTTDFDGTVSGLVTDPTDSDNRVIRYVKTEQAGASSGTTIGTPAGFATNLPLALDDSKMNVRVWSPTAGTPVRFKVENSNDPTQTVETEVITTVAGEWEVLEFDFAQEAPGTAALAFGLSNGWTYNMASIFFNFGTSGQAAGEQTYYFDDVRFGVASTASTNLAPPGFSVVSNPTRQDWVLYNTAEPIETIALYDSNGRLLRREVIRAREYHVSGGTLPAGSYFARVRTATAEWTVRLVRL